MWLPGPSVRGCFTKRFGTTPASTRNGTLQRQPGRKSVPDTLAVPQTTPASRPAPLPAAETGHRQGTLWRINAIKSKQGRLQAMPSRTHGRPWPCEWVARSAGMERSGRFRRAQPEPDGYCNSNGCACEVHYRTHLRRNSFIPAAKVKSQCRVDLM